MKRSWWSCVIGLCSLKNLQISLYYSFPGNVLATVVFTLSVHFPNYGNCSYLLFSRTKVEWCFFYYAYYPHNRVYLDFDFPSLAVAESSARRCLGACCCVCYWGKPLSVCVLWFTLEKIIRPANFIVVPMLPKPKVVHTEHLEVCWTCAGRGS